MNVKDLNNELVLYCKKYALNENLMDYIIDYCKNRVVVGKILDLFNKDVFIELDYIECYWIAKALKDYYKIENLKVKEIDKIQLTDSLHFYKAENVFTITEIQNAEVFYNKKQKTDTIVIKNVSQVSEDLYTSIKIPFSTIAEMFNNGIVNYNFNAQRESTVVDIKLGEYLYQPTVYQDHVEDIKHNMEHGTFFTNHVVFNILDNGEQLFEYNEKHKTLKFTKTAYSQMNIIDGFHRCSAITELVNQNPNVEGFIQANIFVLNIEQAQNYIVQESKASPISKDKKESLKKTIENEIVRYINTAGSEDTNRMYNKISSNIEEVRKFHSKFANQTDLAQILEDNFEKEILKKRKNKVKIKDNLKELFDYWIEMNEDDFEKMYNNKNYKEKNFRTTSTMFCTLIYMYAKFFNADTPQTLIKKIDEINKDLILNEDIQKIFFRANVNKAARKKIYAAIDSIIRKYIPKSNIEVI